MHVAATIKLATEPRRPTNLIPHLPGGARRIAGVETGDRPSDRTGRSTPCSVARRYGANPTASAAAIATWSARGSDPDRAEHPGIRSHVFRLRMGPDGMSTYARFVTS